MEPTARSLAGSQAKTDTPVHFASNPEFLKEGAAIEDFTKPDRVVVGVDEQHVSDTVEELYKPFLRTERPYITVGIESAEMTKYVANCMLATKISFINEMANLCDLVDADINEVRKGIGHDRRIGFCVSVPRCRLRRQLLPKRCASARVCRQRERHGDAHPANR